MIANRRFNRESGIRVGIENRNGTMVGLYGFNRGWRHEWIGSRDAATGMGSIT